MKTMRTALDLTTVRDLVRTVVPTASVYLRAGTGDAADTAEDLELRSRTVQSELRLHGTDGSIVDLVRDAVGQVASPLSGLAVVASARGLLLAEFLPDITTDDRVHFGAPADVRPLLSWLQRRPAYVLVVTDRTGADVTAVAEGAVDGSTRTVVGPDDEIERNAPGGWSQPRYQRRAEDSWLHNAATVADAVTRTVRELRAGLVLVAGDVRAVQLLRDRLPSALRRDVHITHVPGGRGNDGSAANRDQAVAAAVAAYADDLVAADLHRLADASPGLAVNGAHDTLRALADGRVATLFITDDPDDDRPAWYTTDVRCAAEPDHLSHAVPGRLPDVAVRAALLTDAKVRVVPGPLPDGIAGLCRFAP
jgi:hypothetical protein